MGEHTHWTQEEWRLEHRQVLDEGTHVKEHEEVEGTCPECGLPRNDPWTRHDWCGIKRGDA
jgi:hypothetical protein